MLYAPFLFYHKKVAFDVEKYVLQKKKDTHQIKGAFQDG